MNAALLMPSKYLKAAEFRGRDFTLTITRVVAAELDREDNTKEQLGVVYFAETKKGWILNKTNIKCMIAMFGAETDDWHGKQVTVYPENNEMSESGVAIRVRGSPDIAQDIPFTLKLARKKPRRVLLKKTPPRGQRPAANGKPAPSARPAAARPAQSSPTPTAPNQAPAEAEDLFPDDGSETDDVGGDDEPSDEDLAAQDSVTFEQRP
jgi:hypothetical protein